MALNFEGISPVLTESVSSVTLTNSVDLGTVRTFHGEEYVYVYNDTSGTVGIGQGVVMSGYTGMSVTVSSTTFFNVCIGVVKHATLTTASYGWVLTRGFTNLLVDPNASCTVGAPMALVGSGCWRSTVYTNTATTAFSQVTSEFGIFPQAVCVQATASGGTAYGFVRCFGS